MTGRGCRGRWAPEAREVDAAALVPEGVFKLQGDRRAGQALDQMRGDVQAGGKPVAGDQAAILGQAGALDDRSGALHGAWGVVVGDHVAPDQQAGRRGTREPAHTVATAVHPLDNAHSSNAVGAVSRVGRAPPHRLQAQAGRVGHRTGGAGPQNHVDGGSSAAVARRVTPRYRCPPCGQPRGTARGRRSRQIISMPGARDGSGAFLRDAAGPRRDRRCRPHR